MIVMAIVASTSPPMDKIVGISEKKINPKIIAAIGSHAARIDAFPASIYLSDNVNKIYLPNYNAIISITKYISILNDMNKSL